MAENFFEDGLRQALRNEIESHRIRELGDSSPFFEQLMKAFPVCGSKIDWDQVPDAIECVEEDRDLQVVQFAKFFDKVIQRYCLSGDVVYAGDGVTDFALGGLLECMREALPELLSVPQHHYLVAPDSSWCICFTMEGWMGFGFRALPA